MSNAPAPAYAIKKQGEIIPMCVRIIHLILHPDYYITRLYTYIIKTGSVQDETG
jgi:hypothetical protein